jgi:hypothetical protein
MLHLKIRKENKVMTTSEFNRYLQDAIDRIQAVLCKKAGEYASEDRLHNFKIAAGLQQCTPERALGGMLVKHTVSIFDMLNKQSNHFQYPLEQWSEKITDHLNYLILLWALVNERHQLKQEETTNADIS